jgi:hypothetical protein
VLLAPGDRVAEPRSNRCGTIDTARHTQRKDQPLGIGGASVVERRAAAWGELAVVQRRLPRVEVRRIPAPRDAVKGVRARSNRLDRRTLPVASVVPRLVSGSCPIADLVPGVAGGGEARVEVLELSGGALFVLCRRCATAPGERAGRRSEAVVIGIVVERQGERVDAQVIGL